MPSITHSSIFQITSKFLNISFYSYSTSVYITSTPVSFPRLTKLGWRKKLFLIHCHILVTNRGTWTWNLLNNSLLPLLICLIQISLLFLTIPATQDYKDIIFHHQWTNLNASGLYSKFYIVIHCSFSSFLTHTWLSPVFLLIIILEDILNSNFYFPIIFFITWNILLYQSFQNLA